MNDKLLYGVLTDATWARLAPLIEAARPRSKTAPHNLRRAVEAIIWRHENGAKWRAMPAELGDHEEVWGGCDALKLGAVCWPGALIREAA